MKTLQEQPGIRTSVEPQLEPIKGTEFSEDIEIEDREHQFVETKEPKTLPILILQNSLKLCGGKVSGI